MSITQKDVIEYLLELTLRYRLVERALENCDAWFINEGGQIDGWTPQDLKKQFFSHKLVFKRSDWDLIYIDPQIDLLASNDRMIGHYRLISTLALNRIRSRKT